MLAPLALGLTLASSAEAGITEKPGTFERQQSGDCSGYRSLTRDMIELANTSVEDSHRDSIQTSVTKKLPDGNRLQIYTHDGEIIGNVNGPDSWPIESALWSPSDTSTACTKERADFRAQALLFLSQAPAGGFTAPAPVAEFESEVASSAPTASKNSVAARKVLEEMTDVFGHDACKEARLSNGAAIEHIDGYAPFWKKEFSFLAGGYEVSVTGVSDTCFSALMSAPTEYSSAAFQWNSACTWGARRLRAIDEISELKGNRVLAAQCFDSTDSKRGVVKDPIASTGFNY